LLVEEAAIESAEKECFADEEIRARRREREATRRAELDREYVKKFARSIREYFPFCPKGREKVIAEHACRKYSGRIGRTAFAKEFSENAIRLAVIAHIRHAETPYDELLMKGWERFDARAEVEDKVFDVLSKWQEL